MVTNHLIEADWLVFEVLWVGSEFVLTRLQCFQNLIQQ